MTTDTMFEKATRLRLVWGTTIGPLETSDLWTLPLTSSNEKKPCLNDIAISLHRSLSHISVSFVDDTPHPDSAQVELKFHIVKHIIDTKKAENAARIDAVAKAERKKKLLDVLARKEDQVIENLSVEDIRKLIDAT